MDDRFDLARFTAAQADTIAGALAELRRGRKVGHWMWFVFPQLAGLGHSPTARHFGIASLAEARAYLAHPVLGPRLLAAVDAILAAPAEDPAAILGGVDAMKLRSSMTLFVAADGGAPFAAVLDRFYGGRSDPATLSLLDKR